MAAVTELSFLLFALINNIHAQEPIIIREEGDSYTFNLPENTNSCLISRSVGEEKLVLWNTSDLWSNSSSVPEDLKQRLDSTVKTSSYTILNLTHSDSGPYKEECWTEGNVTYENNFTITVCTTTDWSDITARLGETVDLPCEGPADNLDIQWLKQDSIYEQQTWSRGLGDNMTSVMDNVRGRYQVVTNTSALCVSNVTKTDISWYRCLVMNQQQCVSWYSVHLGLPFEVETIYDSPPINPTATYRPNSHLSTQQLPIDPTATYQPNSYLSTQQPPINQQPPIDPTAIYRPNSHLSIQQPPTNPTATYQPNSHQQPPTNPRAIY
ncbi:uncharacterized protein LOC116065602 [Sander lucioperca]|uniref:uncharacterized protein LOC116065602 n=1 Tax=Sander lucioperca TaxID=283035 RepID=UPI0016536DB7|nr:uncharacterized protein LOC116065602 [Sander lucioperca]